MHSGVAVLYFWLGSKRRSEKRLFFSDDSYALLILILPASYHQQILLCDFAVTPGGRGQDVIVIKTMKLQYFLLQDLVKSPNFPSHTFP